jgi:hypothetical protein
MKSFFKNKKGYFLFLFTRLSIVLVKPLTLWILLLQNYKALANDISLFFLLSASLMVIFNNESYYYYYKEYFGASIKSSKLVKELKDYFNGTLNHIFIFATLVFAILYFFLDSLFLSISFLFYLILDKLFDEIQRFYQFNKNFTKWSYLSLIKNYGSFIYILIFSYFRKLGSFETYLSIQFSFSLLSILIFTPINLTSFFRINKRNGIHLIRYFKFYIKRLFLNQLQSISSKNIPLVDRHYINIKSHDLLADYSIITQFSSSIILLVDSFMISHRRKDYVNKNLKIFEIINIKRILFFGISIFFFFELVSFLFLKFSFFNFLSLDSRVLYLTSIYITIYAITQHFSIYCFWHIKRIFTLSIDLLFYFITFLAILFFSLSIVKFVYFLIVLHLFRLTFLILLSISRNSKFHYV